MNSGNGEEGRAKDEGIKEKQRKKKDGRRGKGGGGSGEEAGWSSHIAAEGGRKNHQCTTETDSQFIFRSVLHESYGATTQSDREGTRSSSNSSG